MKVLLKEDVSNLGSIGDVVNVANGYARNYLLPRNFAVEANPRNVKQFEHMKRVVAVKAEKVKKEKLSLAERLSGTRLSFTSKAGEDGKLFGSITSMDIQEALGEQGFEIDRKKIVVEPAIKRVGEHTVSVKLHADITAEVQIEVVRE